MAYKIGFVGILIVLGGCSATHVSREAVPTVLKPLPPLCKETNTTEDMFPQELEVELPQVTKKVSDLEHFPQTIAPYIENSELNQTEPFEIQKHFEENYYRPWSYMAAPICLKEAQWPIRAFKSGYGSNLQPVPSMWFDQMESQSNFLAFSSINRYAVTTKWMDIRTFPTQKPLYKNPALAGEGYPFDMLQNSSVAFNEPIFVSHYSLDGSWAYIFTNNASGWVQSDGIAFVTSRQIESIREKSKVFIAEDNRPLYDKDNRFVVYSRVGMVLPLIKETNENYRVLYIRSNGEGDELLIPKESAYHGFHALNKEDMDKIATQMLHNTYGWGGMYGERDCSSMIRDMFTPFGIWLPRNSASQARKGEVISLKGLDNVQKLALIQEKGVPFETILYKKGHVLLYTGIYEGKVMVLHNIWGIRTIDKSGEKGRVIIGKAVVSTLELGVDVENFDPQHMLLTSLVSMNIFTREPSPVALLKRKEKKIKL